MCKVPKHMIYFSTLIYSSQEQQVLFFHFFVAPLLLTEVYFVVSLVFLSVTP